MDLSRLRLVCCVGGGISVCVTAAVCYRALSQWPREAAQAVAPKEDPVKRSVASSRRALEEFSGIWARELRAELVPKTPQAKEEKEAPLGIELLGTVLEPGNNFAIVQTSAGQTVFCRVGDEIGGVKVLEIQANAITVARGEKKLVLAVKKQKQS